MLGMAENPCESYSLRDRFTCDTCGETPEILNGGKIEGGGPYSIQLRCHGETTTVSCTRQELVHVQYVFPKQEGDES